MYAKTCQQSTFEFLTLLLTQIAPSERTQKLPLPKRFVSNALIVEIDMIFTFKFLPKKKPPIWQESGAKYAQKLCIKFQKFSKFGVFSGILHLCLFTLEARKPLPARLPAHTYFCR